MPYQVHCASASFPPDSSISLYYSLDTKSHMLPRLLPLAHTPVVACPNFLAFQVFNFSATISLNSPRTVAGGGMVVRFYVPDSASAATSHSPTATIDNIFRDDDVSTLCHQHIRSTTARSPRQGHTLIYHQA